MANDEQHWQSKMDTLQKEKENQAISLAEMQQKAAGLEAQLAAAACTVSRVLLAVL